MQESQGVPRKWWLGSVVLNLALIGFVVFDLSDDVTHAPPPSASAKVSALAPMQVDPSWIKEGQPKFYSAVTADVNHIGVSTGLWACDGPGVFEWTYGTDETVHLLEGEVVIQYLGETLKLGPGDTAFFRAGTKALWRVDKRAYKSFILHDPGRLSRWYRRLFRA